MNKELLEQLISKNFSLAKISEETGVTIGKVKSVLKQYELKTLNVYPKSSSIPVYEDTTESTCCKCNKLLPISNFYKTTRPSGKTYPYSYCKACAVGRIKENNVIPYKVAAVNYKGGKCFVCGYYRCLKALEFHHLDPSKKEYGISVTSSWGKYKNTSLEELKPELDKCVLLCANCHREVHDGLITLDCTSTDNTLADSPD